MNKNTKLEIYPEKRKVFDAELRNLKKENISQRNKEIITEFRNYAFSTGSGELRVSKLSYQLRIICRWLKSALNIEKDLDCLYEKNMANLVTFIKRIEEMSEATKADYRRIIKQFYKWFKREDQRLYSKNEEVRIKTLRFYEYIENEISSGYKQEQIDPLTIITDEDIYQVIENGCKTPKEKALISLLHESGARAAEFLSLRVGDIELKDDFIRLHIPDGKTGRRVIPIVKSLPSLLRYLDVHPFKNSKDKHLWVSEARYNLNDPILYNGVKKLINRCFERTSIKKKHNPHWFRHSRATILAPKITEVMLCKYMGWVIGSKQVRTYLHLCNKQLEDVFLSINGIKSQEEEIIKPIKCVFVEL